MMNMMKKIKITLAVVVLIIVGFILGSCTINAKAVWSNPILKEISNNGGYKIIEDSETCNNYIVIERENGTQGIALTICPRYNADGTLYVSK